jgi:hypothetical protein
VVQWSLYPPPWHKIEGSIPRKGTSFFMNANSAVSMYSCMQLRCW